VSAEPDGWVINCSSHPLPSGTVTLEGAPHLLFFSPAISSPSDSGAPQLPVETVNLGIPYDAGISIELTNPVYENRVDQLVAPAPRYRKNRDGESITIFQKDASAYSANRFYPGREIWAGTPLTLRGQRIAPVHIVSAQYNPATRILRRLVGGTVHVRLIGSMMKAGAPPQILSGGDPSFEEVFKTLLANYDQARQWRRPVARAAPAADPTRDWFETGRTYYRLPVAVDGWYRVNVSDLTAAGAQQNMIDTSTLRMISRGADVPVLVRPDSSVEFYARRNYGDSAFYDYWTDTNIYWMTWGGTPGLRYGASPPPPDAPPVNVTSVPVTRHFEQNTAYYRGASDFEIVQPGAVPGKDWVWEYYYPGDAMQHTFVLDSIDASSRPTSVLRVRLYGTTSGSPPVTHHARFWINDSLVGDVTFGQRQQEIFSATIPSSLLKNGSNTIQIQSIDTQTSPNQFYLDWFEIDYQRFLLSTGDQLAFTVPSPGGLRKGLFTVCGFSSQEIDVFDIAGKRMLQNGTVSGNAVSGYRIAFPDTFSASRQYLVVSSAGPLPPAPLRRKVFSDIRNNPQGADYIIVTHSDFLTAARRLAAARQSTNQVRTFIATVQDIFDEFNYGIFNGEKTKSFLAYAYNTWRPPAPAYVLLFGDASYDDHHYFAATVKKDYVPSWGVPTSDNWFGCFDSVHPFLSSLLIGRLSFEDSMAADRMVSKVTGYDAYTPGDWDKNFLFIAGGLSAGDQLTFDGLSDQMINTYVSPSPVGGKAIRVYKASQDIIDSTNRGVLQGIVNAGVVFINFLGHSSGSIWEEDIGDPNVFQNSTGMLPFVSSVSCNVGGFADQTINTLGEEFTRADNRGAIAVWGAVSLGYVYEGTTMANHFLASMSRDTVRSFGALTSAARYGLWLDTGPDPITVEMIQLTPLLGDPLSRLALPVLPDLAVGSKDISVFPPLSTVNDTTSTIGVIVHNYGLVPADSVGITLSDLFSGQETGVLNNANMAPTRFSDSIGAIWQGIRRAGLHTLRVTLDPASKIPEVTKSNNVASIDQYVYGNLFYLVRPMENMVIPPGQQVLRVTTPIGIDSVTVQVVFEIDTTDTFASPFLIDSGPITPGPVTAEWTTPSLTDGRVFYWRVRTIASGVSGAWEKFSFSTSSALPAGPVARWRENTRGQFAGGVPFQTVATDSGVIVGTITPVFLYVRSLGNRAVPGQGYYSVVRASGQTLTGDWTLYGTGYIGVRVSDVTGAAVLKAFDIPGSPAEVDSMVKFISLTPPGNYIGFSVITDGYTNVSLSLTNALKGIGSNLIDSVRPGDAWSIIGRIGRGLTPLEHWSRSGTTADSLQVSAFLGYGSGTFEGSLIPMPQRLRSFRWSNGGVSGTTDAKVALLGIRSNATVDTLRTISKDSTIADISGLNTVIADPAYVGFRAVALLSSKDVRVTPLLRDWSADFELPEDLAISSRTLSVPKKSPQGVAGNSVSLTIYNIGYRKSDSSRVVLSALQTDNSFRPIAYATVDSIPAGGFQTTQIPFLPGGLPQTVTFQARVIPPAASKELIWDNNTALIRVAISGGVPLSAKMHLFADGVQLMDGDYVAAKPKILVHLYDLGGVGSFPPAVDLFVDNVLVGNPVAGLLGKSEMTIARSLDDPTFAPVLANGTHELRIRVSQQNASGTLDTVVQRLIVNVTDQYKILQMFNYPNPFGAETWFTFVITGNTAPEELTVRIYTVAGRKIREIKASPGSLQVGFNRVSWDGRDGEGDEVANGYYLYQVQITGGGKTLTATGKAARVR
jgi:hypothetical protein